MLNISIDTDVDAAYVELSDEPVKSSRRLDERRVVDLAAGGDVRGIEFLYVSDGVDLDDLPMQAAIGELMEAHGIKILTG